jgi:dolichol-phosphate mannosyltransferase
MTDARRPLLVALLPTYNEAGNIEVLVREILALAVPADIHVLVADDNSPDGTGRLVQGMAAADPRVHALIRTKRRGRGAAGIDGFKAALALGADYVVEMDADFSHQPRFIPALLAAAAGDSVVADVADGADSPAIADAAIGSRFVPGGSDSDRSIVRRAITWGVRRFIRRRFHTPVRDVSSGFRLFRRGILERIDLDDLISVGPSIVLEILYKMQRLHATIVEVPIEFVDRRAGATKLSLLTLFETLLMAVKFPKFYGPVPPKGGAA